MKILWTIAAICVIVISAIIFTCVYSVGKAVNDTIDPPRHHIDSTNLSCTTAIDTIRDRVSNNFILINEQSILADSNSSRKIHIQFQRHGGNKLVIVFKPSGMACIDSGQPIYLIFEDGTNIKFLNYYEFNCDGESAIYFSNFKTSDNFKKLSGKTIQAVRVVNSSENYEADFTKHAKTEFEYVMKCITS